MLKEIQIKDYPIILISDTHTNTTNIRKLKEIYPKDLFISLGDFTFLFAKDGEPYNNLSIQYFIDNKIRLNQDYGIDLLEAESGRRSGDINFDFGKILYGANITIPININHSSYRFNLNDVLISDIEVSVESVEV